MLSVRDLDRSTWLLLGLGAAAVLQVFAFKITGIVGLRNAYMGAFMGAAAVAFLQIYRGIGFVTFARIALYGIAIVLTVRVLPRLPDILFGEPRLFDFMAFYLPAKVASADLNLYSPQNYALIAEQMPVAFPDHFRREIIDVGFMYPPATVLLFLPTAGLDFVDAAHTWYMFVGVTIVIAIALLSRMINWLLKNESGRANAVDATALAIIFTVSNSMEGFRYGQTTALLASMMILTIMYSGQRTGGVAAAIGMLIKPVAVIPAALLLIGRYWKSVLAGVATGLLIFVVSLVVIGSDDWISYLGLEFSTEAPPWLYTEAGNHSLLAVLLRTFGIDDVPWGYGYLVALYAVLSGLIATASLVQAIRIVRLDSPTAYCLLLVAALLVYPGTLYTYSILLTIPMAIEFTNQLRARENILVTGLVFSVVGALWLWTLFAANIFLLILLLRRSHLILSSKRNPDFSATG